jgi:hypothetical protein
MSLAQPGVREHVARERQALAEPHAFDRMSLASVQKVSARPIGWARNRRSRPPTLSTITSSSTS